MQASQAERHIPAELALGLLYLAVGLNLVLIAISFFPWFSGTSATPGFADRMLGHHRMSGWRLDFLWLLMSNAVLFFVAIGCAVLTDNRRARRVGVFTLIELGFFVLYVFHALASGTFDMG